MYQGQQLCQMMWTYSTNNRRATNAETDRRDTR